MAIKKKNLGLILVIILMIIIGIVGIGAFVINKMANPTPKLEKPGEELGYDIFIGEPDMPVTTSTEEGRNLVEELKAVNVTYSDAVAWLKVPKTQIWGETYLDYRCDVKNLAAAKTNIIIYGHNTETDNRFTPLLNYKKEEFYNKHKYIELATLDKTYTYEIFTVYRTDTKFYYIDTVFNSDKEFDDFVESCAKKSRYGTEVEVSGADKILTLSTCDYSLKDGRFVVQARLVENP